MLAVSAVSLSGGQGKTTACLFLSRLLSKKGRTLAIDSDPQSNLTFYLGHEVESDQPTLLEALKKQVKPEDAIYDLSSNLWLIPSDDALDGAQDYLAKSGMGAVLLRQRLSSVSNLFDFCVIDAPPQRSQLSLAVLGAADFVVIPVEATSKGLNSLLRTLELIDEVQELGAFQGKILGVLPFRDRWAGANQTRSSREAIEGMRDVAGEIPILPSIVESEKFKQAVDEGKLLSELGYANLELPFSQILNRLQELRR